MKLALILLFVFGFYTSVLSQQKLNPTSTFPNYYQPPHSSSLDTFPSFKSLLQEQKLLKSSELNQFVIDSIVHERWGNDYYYGPRYDKIVEVYGSDDSFSINRILLQRITHTDYESEFAQDVTTKMEYSKIENTKINTLYQWDNITKTWKDSIKEENTFNDKSMSVLYVKTNWNSENNEWVNDLKTESQYYENGLSSGTFNYYWNDSTREWQFSEKTEVIIDSLGRITEYGHYKWSNIVDDWIYTYKYETIFETDSTLQSIYYGSYYNYDEARYVFMPTEKRNILYYPNGNEKQIAWARWDSRYNKWEMPTISRYEYAYDSVGHITFLALYIWNYNTSDWENGEKYEYVFDARGNRISEKRYDWLEDSTNWFLTYETECTFDSDYDITYEYKYYYDLIGNNRKQKGIYNYNENGGLKQILFSSWNENTSNDWELNERVTYYYSEYIVGRNDIPVNTNLLIFPNPADEILHFDLTNNFNSEVAIEIFDINGKKIRAAILQQNSISTTGLDDGIYFYHLTSNNQNFKGKFIVQH